VTGPGTPGSHGWALAVDFGTSNTAAALRRPDGVVQVVRLSAESDQMPSCVLAADDGLRVGDAAVRQALLAPDAFERTPKLRLGEKAVVLGGRTGPPTELVAAVLRHVLQRSARVSGGAPMQWVALTYPEGWGERRRRELVDAAELAGLPAAQLVPEPVAAAAWYVRAGHPGPGQRVAVFDFGGGTCDVAVLQVATDAERNARFVIAASAGEDGLGGDHIDARVADWVVGQLRAGGRGSLADAMDDLDHPEAWLILRDEVRRAKHTLSDYTYASVAVRAGEQLATVQITRDEFDRLIAPDVERAVSLTRRVLEDAGLIPNDVAAFYCTGGSSHMPLVHRRLTELLGRPPDTLEDPKLVVAMGAAAIAGLPAATPLAEAATPPTPPPPPPPPAPRPQRPPTQQADRQEAVVTHGRSQPDQVRRRLIAALAAVVALIAVGIAVLVYVNSRPQLPPTANPEETGVGGEGNNGGEGGSEGESDNEDGGDESGPPSNVPRPPHPCRSLDAAECDLLQQIPAEIAEDCRALDASVALAHLQCSVPASARQGPNYSEIVKFLSYDSVASRDSDVTTLSECGTYESSPPGSDVVTDTGTLYCGTLTASGNAMMLWTYDGKPITGRVEGVGPDGDALQEWFFELETVSLEG
jgi:hypothetical protein